jgi:hypothetical protein
MSTRQANVDRLYDTVLALRLAELEGLRHHRRHVAGLRGRVFAGFRYLIPGLTAFINYRQRFKREVVAEIFRIACPTAAYRPEHGIPAAVFDEPEIFNLRGSFTSDDHVRGTIGQTPFEAAEVGRQYSPR